jgi:hypothetical protein
LIEDITAWFEGASEIELAIVAGVVTFVIVGIVLTFMKRRGKKKKNKGGRR